MAAPAFSVPTSNSARLADPALREALLKFARRRLPPNEVDDLVQNTLADALVAANPPADERDFQRWVHGIARHKVADLYRRRGRRPTLDADLDSRVASFDAGPATGELSQWIERELPKTDGAQATLHWLLREGDGESLDEIARDEAMPAPRVRQRVSRLRRHLHARWLALGAAGLALLLGAGVALHLWRRPEAALITRDSVPSAEPALPTPLPALSAGPSNSPPISKAAPVTKQFPSTRVVPKVKHSPKPLQKRLAPKKAAPNPAPLSKTLSKQTSSLDDLVEQKKN